MDELFEAGMIIGLGMSAGLEKEAGLDKTAKRPSGWWRTNEGLHAARGYMEGEGARGVSERGFEKYMAARDATVGHEATRVQRARKVKNYLANTRTGGSMRFTRSPDIMVAKRSAYPKSVLVEQNKKKAKVALQERMSAAKRKLLDTEVRRASALKNLAKQGPKLSATSLASAGGAKRLLAKLITRGK